MAKAALGADVAFHDLGRHVDLENPHVPQQDDEALLQNVLRQCRGRLGIRNNEGRSERVAHDRPEIKTKLLRFRFDGKVILNFCHAPNSACATDRLIDLFLRVDETI